MCVGRDAVGVDQISTLGVSHTTLGNNGGNQHIRRAWSAFDVLHSFGDRFDLLFNMIQAFLLANGIGGHCGDHFDFRQRRASAEIAVNQFALNLPGQIIVKWLRQHQVTRLKG